MDNKKPNILIIMTDQQRADLRKSCGYELDTMPFLDEWAKGGVDFNRAYTSNPTCMPARVSMFTGRYSSCHRVRTNHNRKDAYYTKDLLDVLKELGYKTALCGKNHSHHFKEDFNFSQTNGHLGNEGEVNSTAEEIEFAEFLTNTKHMETHEPSPGGNEVQHPYRNVDSALEFIDSLKKDIPFFAWVSFAEPHNPYQVPEAYYDMFPPDALPPLHSAASDLEEKGERFVWLGEIWNKILGEDMDERIQRIRSNYHGMLRLIDDQVKRLIEGLRIRDLEQETIIIYLSDHGDFVGEYGLIRKGGDLSDILTHIPMIWTGPGISAQGKCDNFYGNIVDILPTICDILKVDIPFGCQGKSLLPILKNMDIPDNEFNYTYSENGYSGHYWKPEDKLTPQAEGALSEQWDQFDCLNSWTQSGQVRSLWKGDYHIQLDMMGSGHLYDRSKDPYEVQNLWEDPKMQLIKLELLTELTAAILKASDPLPAPHYRYRTKIHPKGYWNQLWISEDPGM